VKSLAGARPTVRTARPLQISIPLDVVSANVTAAATRVTAAINHFDFQTDGRINFKTLSASGAVVGR
jgi:hypothetical protein